MKPDCRTVNMKCCWRWQVLRLEYRVFFVKNDLKTVNVNNILVFDFV